MSEAKRAPREGLLVRVSFQPAYAEFLESLRIRTRKQSREQLLSDLLRDFARDHGFKITDNAVSEFELKKLTAYGLVDHDNVRSLESKRFEAEQKGYFCFVVMLFYDEEYRWPQRLMEKLNCNGLGVLELAIEAFKKKLLEKSLN